MTVTPVRSAATDALTAKLDDPQTAAALLTLLDHVDLLAILVQGLSGMIERSETIGASIGDGIVELRQTFAANPALQGRDVNPDEIVSSLIALAGALPAATPGIVAAAESGVIDRILGSGITDPAAVDQLSTLAAGLATGSERFATAPIEIGGMFSLLGLLKDPDINRSLSFFATVAKAIGQELAKPRPQSR